VRRFRCARLNVYSADASSLRLLLPAVVGRASAPRCHMSAAAAPVYHFPPRLKREFRYETVTRVRHIFRLLRAGAVKLSAEDTEGADGCRWRHWALRPARRAVADYLPPQCRCKSDMGSRANEIVPGTRPGGRWRR
jgi:hypothetical protein